MKSNKSGPCEGCFYWRSLNENLSACNYFLDTGTRRPCEPGAGCTVRVNGKKRKTRKKKPKGEEVNHDNP